MEIHRLVRNRTQALILQAVRDFPNCSRSTISEKTGLPLAAISRSLPDLLSESTLKEMPLADNRGARRKRALALNAEKAHCIGVEYGPLSIEAVAVDLSYRVVVEDKVDLNLKSMKQRQRINTLLDFVQKFVNKTSGITSPCLGIALVDPGVVEEGSGVAVTSTILENWENAPVGKMFRTHYGMPVRVLSSGQARIRAAGRFETEPDVQDVMYVEYGEGIGCGLMLHGCCISGGHNRAGELGHVQVSTEPVPCRCGGFGCLEAVSALTALVRRVNDSFAKTPVRSLLADRSSISGLDVLEAAAKDDRLAIHVVDEAFEYIARAVAAVVNVVDPRVVFLDPIFRKAGMPAVDGLMRNIKKNLSSLNRDGLDIRVSSLEFRAGALGGAVAILDRALTK